MNALTGIVSSSQTFGKMDTSSPFQIRDIAYSSSLGIYVLSTSGGLRWSIDGVAWTKVTGTGSTASTYKIEWFSRYSAFVTSSQTAIFTSTDGKTWTAITTNSLGGTFGTADSTSIIDTGTSILLAGVGRVFRSTNLVSWQEIILPQVGSVALGRNPSTGRVIASTGSTSVTPYSDDDGLTWTNGATTGQFYAHVWDPINLRNIGIGQQSIYVTTDAVTWSVLVTLSNHVQTSFRSAMIRPDTNKILMVGSASDFSGLINLTSSTDGTSFNSMSFPQRSDFYNVKYTTSDEWWMFGHPSTASTAYRSRDDGTTWYSQDTIGITLRKVVYVSSLEKFVAVGPGAYLTSTDGLGWTLTPVVDFSALSMVYNTDTSQWVIAGGGGFSAQSKDFVQWTRRRTSSSDGINSINSIIYVPDQKRYWFVSRQVASYVAYTNDLTRLTTQSTASGTSYDILHATAHSKFIVVASGIVYTSDTTSPPVTWTAAYSNAADTLYGVAYSSFHSRYVVCGATSTNNRFLYSSDTSTWTVGTYASAAFIQYDVGCNDQTGVFVSVGEKCSIYRSNDGITWTQVHTNSTRGLSTARHLWSVTYSSENNQWVAVGDELIMTSFDDGVTWNIATMGSYGL